MATWKENILTELTREIRNHKGQGESRRFYELRDECLTKIGNKNWERLLSKAKRAVVKERV